MIKNLDDNLSSGGKNGLIWWLLIGYTSAISGLFYYLHSAQDEQIVYLKTEIENNQNYIKEIQAQIHFETEKARQDERRNILEILKSHK